MPTLPDFRLETHFSNGSSATGVSAGMDIRALGPADTEGAFDVATRAFVEGSALHRALGIGLAEYREYLRPSFMAMVAQGLSVCAVEDDQVVGCMIAVDMHGGDGSTATGAFAPLGALLDALGDAYRREGDFGPGEVVLVDIGAVAASHAGRGLYRAMRLTTQDRARERGFRRVVGELTSSATQHVVLGMPGQRQVAAIRFAEFCHDGAYPFAGITEPEAVVVAEGVL